MPIRTPSGALKARLNAGEVVGCHWLSLGSPALAELAAAAGADTLVVDMQHGLWDRAGLEAAIGTANAAATLLVRTADQSTYAISSALDAGADGVIAPLVDSAEQCVAVVAAARYPPHGRRSAGGIRPLVDFGAYRAAAERMLVAVMIETAEAVDAAEDIAATPGLDMVFIGTGDLALSLGAGPGARVFEAALQRVLTACRAAGIAAGAFTPDLDHALKRAAQGFQFVVFANDIDQNLGKLAQQRQAFAAGLGGGRRPPS